MFDQYCNMIQHIKGTNLFEKLAEATQESDKKKDEINKKLKKNEG